MGHRKFDLSKLERLNDPGRFETLPPDVFWEALGEPHGVAVEIGAGTGVFAAEFVARSQDLLVYAVDTEDAMLEWMRANRQEVADGRIVPVKAAEARVPLPDGIASAVYMINVHHELESPAESYAEAYRLTAPGGKILVADWADRDTPKGPSRAVRTSAAQLREHLEAAGFERVVIDSERLPWHLLAVGGKSPVWTGGDPHP